MHLGNAHGARAWELYRLDRYGEALAEAGLAQAEEPDDGQWPALSALCAIQLDRKKEARQHAEKAIQLDPEYPFAYYAHAVVMCEINLKIAEKSAAEALRLDSENSSYYALAAALASMRSDWPKALRFAEQGLELDPDDAECLNIRAQALSFLGRASEAKAAFHESLNLDPDSARSHAMNGWASLRAGHHQQATEEFKTALRIDPNEEHAREGLLEALRVRFPAYRWIFMARVWISRFDSRTQWMLSLGAFILIRVLGAAAKQTPALTPFVVPIVAIYGLFVVSTWIAEPLMNISLLFHPLGRLALSRTVRRESWVLLSFLVIGLAALLFKGWIVTVLAFVFVLLTSLATHITSSEKGRIILFWILAAMGYALMVLAAVSMLSA